MRLLHVADLETVPLGFQHGQQKSTITPFNITVSQILQWFLHKR